MKKIAAAGSVLAVVSLSVLGSVGAAQATDDGDSSSVSPPSVSPPTSTVQSENVSDNNASSPTTAATTLPNTGGPNEVLLGGAVALVMAGGASVLVSRRRQTN
jgi:LPXTG-motif cell wall-anchored protein